MGAIKAVFLEVKTGDLCGSCRFYQGNPLTGNLTGHCPVDGPGAYAKKDPCDHYQVKEGGIYAN
jgi:hypothetical protein